MDDFNQFLIKYNFQDKHIVEPNLINQIEELINFTLPHDYKFHLQNFSAFENFIGKEYVRLWDLELVLENNIGYGITEFLSGVVGIGSNGGGELLAIEHLGNQTYRVLLIPFADLDKDAAIEIGSSFTDFLLRLDKDQTWF